MLFRTRPTARHLEDGEAVAIEITGCNEKTTRLRLARYGPIRIELPAGLATATTIDVDVPRIGFIEQRVDVVPELTATLRK